MKNITQLIAASLFGFLSAAGLLAFAANGEPPKPQLPEKILIAKDIYTCENLPKEPRTDEMEEHALRQLRATCQTAAHAMQMIQIWQNDPFAGEVLEQ